MDPFENSRDATDPPPTYAPAVPFHRGLGPWLGGVVIGVAIIALGAVFEAAVAVDTPLDDAVILVPSDSEAAIPEGLAAAVESGDALPLALYPLPASDGTSTGGGPPSPFADMTPRSWLVVLDDEGAQALAPILAPMLVDGTLPRPESREVLAGPSARTEGFELDGAAFTVSGQLGNEAGLFFRNFVAFAPPLPETPSEDSEPREGYLFLDYEALREAIPEDDRGGYQFSAGMHFAPGGTIALAILGLFLVALCGSIAWIRLLHNLAGRGGMIFRPAFDACLRESALLIRTHAILYGVFFGLMILGLLFTDAYVALLAFVQEIFATGELRDIGEAYESGNILAAKFQTWRHNYLVATVLLSALPSLLIPGAALVKNAFSFALIGFVMVPVLADTARVMSFHSITMWLELEAYILVSFASVLLPVKVMRAFAEPSDIPTAERMVQAYARGAAVLGSMTLIAGIILLVAALYEATTLILLR